MMLGMYRLLNRLSRMRTITARTIPNQYPARTRAVLRISPFMSRGMISLEMGSLLNVISVLYKVSGLRLVVASV